jgi:hypothetical protein
VPSACGEVGDFAVDGIRAARDDGDGDAVDAVKLVSPDRGSAMPSFCMFFKLGANGRRTLRDFRLSIGCETRARPGARIAVPLV